MLLPQCLKISKNLSLEKRKERLLACRVSRDLNGRLSSEKSFEFFLLNSSTKKSPTSFFTMFGSDKQEPLTFNREIWNDKRLEGDRDEYFCPLEYANALLIFKPTIPIISRIGYQLITIGLSILVV